MATKPKRKPRKKTEPETLEIEVLTKGAKFLAGPIMLYRTREIGTYVLVVKQTDGGELAKEDEDE